MKIAWQVLDKSNAGLLARTLATRVVENIAGLSPRNLFYGQPDAPRVSVARKAPPVTLYTGLPTFGVPPEEEHVHAAVATIVEGKMNVARDGLIYRAQQGDWLVFQPHVSHMEFCLHSRLSYRAIWFQFPLGPGIKIGDTRYSRESGFQVDRYEVQSCPVDVHRNLDSIMQNPAQSIESIRWKLLHLLSWWLCMLGEEGSEPVLYSHIFVDRIHALLDGSDASLSVTEVARKMGLSLSHVSRLYRLYTGQNLHRAIQEKRIKKACVLLTGSTMLIKEISFMLGFSDLQHFNHAFHHVMGVSPSAYRNNPETRNDN